MSDVQSLTLPKVMSRSRARRRRPRRPSWWTVFWACYCLWCVYVAVLGLTTRQWLFAASDVSFLCGAWPCLLGRRRWIDNRVVALGWAFWVAGLFA